MRWVGYIAFMTWKMHTKSWLENVKGRDHSY